MGPAVSVSGGQWVAVGDPTSAIQEKIFLWHKSTKILTHAASSHLLRAFMQGQRE
jgi:hypothetical protein